MECECILEGKALLENDDDLFSEVFTFLWEGGVIKPLDERVNYWFTFILL